MKKLGLLLLLSVLAFNLYNYKDELIEIKKSIATSYENSSQPTTLPEPSNNIGLDESTINIIEKLVADIDLKPEEVNLNHAIKLDHQIGRPLWQKKKYKETYNTYKKVLKISYMLDNLRGMQIALSVLGDIQKNLGQHDEAMDVILLAYKLALKEGLPHEFGVLETIIADNLQKQDRGLSLLWRLKAKKSLHGTNYIQDQVSLLGDIAKDLHSFSRTDEALNIYKEAYELSEKIGNNKNEQHHIKLAQYNYAKALISNKDFEKALPIIDKHFKYYNSEEDKSEWYYASMLFLEGICHSNLDNKEAALDAFMQAYFTYELQRSLANTDKARARLDKSNYKLVNKLVYQNITNDNLEQALILLESNKAKTLTDIFGDPKQKEIYQEWKRLESQHAKELESLFDNDDEIVTKSNYKEKMIKFYDLQEKQKKDELNLKLNQESKQILLGNKMTLDNLKKTQGHLPKDTAILSLFTSPEEIGIFLITKDNIEYFKTDYSVKKLLLRVKEIKYMIGNPKVHYYKIPSEEIYNNVFDLPLKKLGGKYKRLIISSDSFFHNLSPSILYDGKKFLAEKYIVHQYPSLRYYNPIKAKSNTIPLKGLTCVDPDIINGRLPFQKETSNVIKEIGGDKITELIGRNCTNNKITSEIERLNEGSFLHIGAHGVFLNYDPMRSGIYLASDEHKEDYYFWNAMEIGTIDMKNIKLLTLSSCDTAVLDEESKRDVFGILRGVFYSGVENVIAPLWPVQDLSTSILMQNFYKNYFKHGDPAKALWETQNYMINSEKYKHPFYWAGFITMGGAA